MTGIGVASGQAETYRTEVEAHGIPARVIDGAGGALPEILLADPARLPGLGRLDGVAWVQSTWAGVDAVDWSLVPAETIVTGLPGVFSAQMREFVFGHLLAVSHRTDRRPTAWQPQAPDALAGSVMGILGAGSIGGAIAETARHFGMEVVGCSRSGRPDPRYERMFSMADLARFSTGLDHLVVVLPATDLTRHVVDASVLDQLSDGAVLVNVGRGSTVVLDDVVDAVRSGRLSRAVLDVTEPEPLPDDHPAWQEPNIVITGHVAAISRPADVVDRFVENLERFQRGERLVGVIDREQGY